MLIGKHEAGAGSIEPTVDGDPGIVLDLGRPEVNCSAQRLPICLCKFVSGEGFIRLIHKIVSRNADEPASSGAHDRGAGGLNHNPGDGTLISKCQSFS